MYENELIIEDGNELTDENINSIMNISAEEQAEILKNIEVNINPNDLGTDDVKKIIEGKNEKKNKKKKDVQLSKNINPQTLLDEFNAFLQVNDIVTETPDYIIIPTGIELLDIGLGGGFVSGTMAIIVGPPGGGKTMLVAQTMGNMQRMFELGMLNRYLDAEEAMNKIRLASLGVTNPMIEPIIDITVEKVFKSIETISLFKTTKNLTHIPSMLAWDSIANTLSVKEREADDINKTMGYKAKLLSTLIPKYLPKLRQNNILLLAINQLRDVLDIGPYSKPKDLKMMSNHKEMPGGTSIKYNAFHLLEMKTRSIADPEKLGFDGFISEVKCVKNKLFTPNIKMELVANFKTGFSNFHTNYHFLVETGRINTGAWNYLINLPNKKFRTRDAESMYLSDPDFKQAFDEVKNEAFKAEIIDKYSASIKFENNEEQN